MKKEIIYNTNFILDENICKIEEENYISLKNTKKAKLKIELSNDVEFFWPNREGELIDTNNIEKVLNSYNIKTASICYPSTASMNLFIIYYKKTKEAIVIFSQADLKGRIAIFSLKEEDNKKYLKIESESSNLTILKYMGDSFDQVVNQFINDKKYKSILKKRENISCYQVQVGFISPFNKNNVDKKLGFDVCIEISQLMKKNIGENNILHIFAYHGAHDSNYPQYFPSNELGGQEKLKHAINEIHKNKQLCSLYMNARLFSASLIDDFEYLKDSIVKDSEKNFIVESYYDRDFFVMDPKSEKWRSLLVKRAKYLKSLGVDIIQLDQVAGRAAMGEIGYSWGEGYRKLIESIQDLGLEVWIQGINEIYAANRFELCFRYPNILDDGTIRGGHPFGKSYPLVPFLLDNQNFIIPLASTSLIDSIDRKFITVDLENLPGELSLYSNTYLNNLKKNLKAQIINE